MATTATKSDIQSSGDVTHTHTHTHTHTLSVGSFDHAIISRR
jgi:hypothetical protein